VLSGLFIIDSSLLVIALYTSSDFTQFGFLATSLVLYCILSGFILSFVFTTAKQIKIVLLVFSAIFYWFLVLKLTFERPVYELLPLNVCNIVGVLIILRAFYKNNFFDSYIMCFGLLGVFANFFLGDWFSYKDQFYHIYQGTVVDANINVGSITLFSLGGQVFESNMVHNLYATFCIFLLLSKQMSFTPKLAMKNFFWIVPLYLILIFTNQIYKFNFLYTSQWRNPLNFIYQAFFTKTGFFLGRFQINLLYDLLIIGGCALLLFGLSFFLNFINLKFIKKTTLGKLTLIG
jgi:hypothetical protein